ncbi:MAG TPA: ribosomal protein S18-alanine N-acetyltransferase [Anaerolineae bacterium]|nr:ribosomal protein S18-alanine N-acetyltransferase [Anaerolineae bacterium]
MSTTLSRKPKVTIREMRIDDIEQVSEIDRLSFSLPWPKSAYRFEILENERSYCWVAEVNESERPVEIIGMIIIWLISDDAHIATLAIHPKYRRLGIAKELLRKVLLDVIEKGAQIATLEVRESNTAAQDLYTGFGFEIVGRRWHYYVDNQEDAIQMAAFKLNRDEYLSWLRNRENRSLVDWLGK